MKNTFEWLLAWRYTRGARGSNSSLKMVSFVSWLSMIGTVIGVASLIVVMSVMNGFVTEIRDKMLSVVPHVQVYPAPDAPDGWSKNLTAKIKQNPEVLGVAPYMSSASIILQEGDLKGVKVEGVDPALESEVSQVAQKLIAGQLTDLKAGEFNVILGAELANHLGVKVADKVTVMAPEINTTIAGMAPRLRDFNVVGIIYTDHFEVDNSYVFMHVADANSLFQTGAAGLRIKIKDMNQADAVADWIANNAGMPVQTRVWTSFNPGWFSAVKTEKVMISIILLLIVAVAAFNLISMLMMTVKEKNSDIAILRTLGASRGSIMKIFMVQGALIGGLGTLFGVFWGVLIAANVGSIVGWIERVVGMDLLPKGQYMIGVMPSQVRPTEVLIIAVCSFLISLLATIYPSRKAANLEPARALRYE
ncbi:MAG: lipoprotein-releasing ABC transporter permease subunit [Formosimonas sp.]